MTVIHVLDVFRHDLSHRKGVAAVLQYTISGNPCAGTVGGWPGG